MYSYAMYKKPLTFTLKRVTITEFELYIHLKTNDKTSIALVTPPPGHH